MEVSLVQANVIPQFAHMVERNNLMHETAVEEVRRSEVVTVTSLSKSLRKNESNSMALSIGSSHSVLQIPSRGQVIKGNW